MSEELDRPSPRASELERDAVAVASVLYFACVFGVGVILGPIRVLWVEPVVGATFAVLLEAPFLIGAMIFASRYAPRWAKVRGRWPSYLAIGLLALVFQQIADLAVGFGLRGMTLTGQLAYFSTPPGWIYAAALFVFAIAPLFAKTGKMDVE